MRPALRRFAVAVLLLAVFALPRRAHAAVDDPIGTALASRLAVLDPLARTGVLYDRVLPLARLEALDGSPGAPVVDLARFRQALDELRRASTGTPVVPDLSTLDAGVAEERRMGVVPLAVLDRPFDRLRAGALSDGSLQVTNGRLEPVPGRSPLVSARAFAAAALTPRTYRGAAVTFALDPARYVADAPPAHIEIDFDDGAGFRDVALGERVRVGYTATGSRTLVIRVTREDGSVAEARTAFDVAAATTPLPNDTLHITATTPYQGQFGTGDAYVDLAPGHTAITNPVVVIEGFDLDNSMNWDELYALLDQQNLIEDLRADGFDAIVLNFTDATDAIQKNSYVVEALIEQVETLMPAQASIALVGASMGGLCSRFALADMETHGIPHRVRTWISFDGPQEGADIPLGLQYWINFFSGQSSDAAAFLAILNRPAARQMLLYHYTSPAGTTGQADPLRATLASDLAGIGNYPTMTRRVAIANGSGTGQNQGFLPGDEVIRWEYSSALVAITGDVWAVPNLSSHQIFNGSIRILFSTTTQNVTVSGTQPWDGAPGGSRASFAELDTVPAPYGDIVALHPSHCFIPTVSSLDLATGDPFFDIAGTPDLLSLSPFDALYYPTANQEHVEITPENAAWVKQEIESGVVSVPRQQVASAFRLTVDPNPARGVVTIDFTMPAAARTRLAIYDVDGREVRRLADGPEGAGARTFQWDGRGPAGAPVPAGIYFARLTAGAKSATARFARLR